MGGLEGPETVEWAVSVLGLCKESNQFTGLPAVRAGFISNSKGGLREVVWPLFSVTRS